MMDIYELKNYQMNPALAYTIGLIYPLYKEKELNAKKYMLGCVNHNKDKITQDELNKHFQEVLHLFKSSMGDDAPTLKTNRTVEYTISPKVGFTALIEIGDLNKDECLNILTDRVNEIKNSSEDIRSFFVRGCFDGRASWDTTAHYLSIDVDRDYLRQDLVIEVIESLGININVNRRANNHSKNDQIRIKPSSLEKFILEIGLYSECRKNIIKRAIVLL